MKKILLMSFLLLSLTIFSQKIKVVNPKIERIKKVSNNLKMYCNGGEVSIITKNDLIFQKKYSVIIVDLGCLHASGKDLENYKKLNSQTFEFLKTKFGLKWVSEINLNTIGLSEWKIK